MAVQISGNDITVPRDGSFTRNVTIGGTLTYEDVTNIDSVGLVTARTGIEIGARPGVAASISVDGNAIFSGITTLGGSGTGGSGTSNLTYDGNNLSQSIDAAAEGIQITGSGAHYGEIKIDSNRTGANQHVGTIKGAWNGTQIARIDFNTGTDTSNKDDGQILFDTSSSGGTLVNRARIKEDGSIQLTSENTTGWSLDAGDDSASYTAIDNHFPTTNRTLYINRETTHRSIAFWNKNGSDGYGFGLDNSGNFKVVYGTSERVRIDSSGRLLIGTGTARAVGGESNPRLHIEGTGATSNSWVNLTRFSANNGSANIQFAKSRSGTAGTYTVVQNGDNLGQISFLGADGTDMANYAALIKSQVDGTPGSNDMPGKLVFATTADGAGFPTPRMEINSAGIVTCRTVPSFKIAIDGQTDPNQGTISENNGFTLSATFRDAFNEGNHFDEATGRFTAPVEGLYFFHFSIMRYSNNGTGSVEMRIKRNSGTILARTYRASYSSNFESHNVSTITRLLAGHYVEFVIGANMSTYNDDSYMLGYLIG